MDNRFMEAFINPVKSRLLLDIQGRRQATAGQLAEANPAIPQATLYRYLKRMLEDDVIKVVGENKIRGESEKIYSINIDLAAGTKKLLEDNCGEAYFEMFTQYMMQMMNEFREYAMKPDIDILHDGSGFSAGPFYATAKELEDAMTEIGRIAEKLRQNQPGDNRKLRTMGVIITPPKEYQAECSLQEGAYYESGYFND